MPAKSAYNLCSEAKHLLTLGRNDDAIPLLLQAASEAPDYARPHNLLAQAHYSEDRYGEALKSAERATSLDPSDEWPHRVRALCLLHTNRKKDALESARRAVHLAPHQPEALHTLALCLSENRMLPEAKQVAANLVSTAPHMSLAHFTAGLIAHHGKEWKEAEEHYRRALSINAQNWEAMNNLGVVLNKQGNRKEAIEMFHNAARLRPAEATSRKNLKESVGTYVSGGAGTIFLLIQLARVTSISMGETTKNYAPYVILPLLAAAVGYLYWRRKMRLAELHESVKTFYDVEQRRERRESRRRYGRILIVLCTAGPIVFWTILALQVGPRAAGLTSSGGIIYAALIFALIAEVVWLVRERNERSKR